MKILCCSLLNRNSYKGYSLRRWIKHLNLSPLAESQFLGKFSYTKDRWTTNIRWQNDRMSRSFSKVYTTRDNWRTAATPVLCFTDKTMKSQNPKKSPNPRHFMINPNFLQRIPIPVQIKIPNPRQIFKKSQTLFPNPRSQKKACPPSLFAYNIEKSSRVKNWISKGSIKHLFGFINYKQECCVAELFHRQISALYMAS